MKKIILIAMMLITSVAFADERTKGGRKADELRGYINNSRIEETIKKEKDENTKRIKNDIYEKILEYQKELSVIQKELQKLSSEYSHIQAVMWMPEVIKETKNELEIVKSNIDARMTVLKDKKKEINNKIAGLYKLL